MNNTLRVYENLSEAVGCTPLIRLRKLLAHYNISCSMWAKCEFFNPTGSFTDRLSRAFVTHKENNKSENQELLIDEEITLKDAVSLLSIATSRDFCLKMNNSGKSEEENFDLSNIYKNEIFPQDTEKNKKSDFCSKKFRILSENNENNSSIFDSEFDKELDMFCEEIYKQMNKKINYVVLMESEYIINTIASKILKIDADVVVIGVKTTNSIDELTEGGLVECNDIKKESSDAKEHKEEFNNSILWIEVNQPEIISVHKDLVKEEGFFIDKTSGGCIVGALKYIKSNSLQNDESLNFVVVLNNYIGNEFYYNLNEELTVENETCDVLSSYPSLNNDIYDKPIKDYLKYLSKIPYLDNRLTVSDCLDLFNKNLPILPIRKGTQILGIVTKASLLKAVKEQNLHSLSSCAKFLKRNYFKISTDASISSLQHYLEQNRDTLIFEINEEKLDIYAASLSDIFSIIQEGLKHKF